SDRRGLRRAVSELARRANWLVVEGVGGFRVPLGADWDSADLAHDLGLPVVMVVGMRLGCLSHALLTAHAVRARVASCRLGGQWHRCGDVPFRGERRHPTRAAARALPGCGAVACTPDTRGGRRAARCCGGPCGAGTLSLPGV